MNMGKFFLFTIIFSLDCIVCRAQLTYSELQVMYDSAWTFKNLQMIPIKFKPKGDGCPTISGDLPTRLISFSEALLKHKIKVQEMQYENGADVNLLQVTNHSKQNIVVQGGEVLEGGKQDRMVGETKYRAPGTTDYIQVYCVEKRRWSPKAKDFKHQGMANREVQKVMNLSKRQSQVWKEIDKEFKAVNKTSETWSYLELYNNRVTVDTSYINFFTRKYVESDSNIGGFIFITDNKIMSTEIFAGNSLLDVTFGNMLNSYVQSAISNGAKPTVPIATQKQFMDEILSSEEGQKLYLIAHGRSHKGSDGKTIHLIAYPE